MTTTAHPEEIECFRNPSGGFSQDKRYEYTYATRKSWEYIPTLGRKDWQYFTNKVPLSFVIALHSVSLHNSLVRASQVIIL